MRYHIHVGYHTIYLDIEKFNPVIQPGAHKCAAGVYSRTSYRGLEVKFVEGIGDLAIDKDSITIYQHMSKSHVVLSCFRNQNNAESFARKIVGALDEVAREGFKPQTKPNQNRKDGIIILR